MNLCSKKVTIYIYVEFSNELFVSILLNILIISMEFCFEIAVHCQLKLFLLVIWKLYIAVLLLFAIIIVCDFQILEQATERLRLTQAARRLYTADGLIVLDLDDLIEWVKEQYVKEAHKQMRAEARARKAANKTGKLK